MSPSVLRARSLAGFLGLVAAFALTTVHAQAGCVYDFSEYDNVYPSSDGSTLYYSVSAVDNSGCGHSDYTTVANIQSPSGRQGSASQAGLAATAAIAFEDETGTYSIYSSGSFYCPFAQQIVYNGWGSGGIFAVAITNTSYRNPVVVNGACSYTATACTSGTPSCTGGVLPQLGGSCPDPIQDVYLRVVFLRGVTCVATFWTPGAGECN